MKTFVIDNSVIMKLIFSDEDNYDVVCDIIEDFKEGKVQIIQPILWYFELINVLKFKFKSEEDVNFYVNILKSLEITIQDYNEKVEKIAISISTKHEKASFYDAYYHALAIYRNGTFITNDRKYFNLAHNEGSIVMLKDYANFAS